MLLTRAIKQNINIVEVGALGAYTEGLIQVLETFYSGSFVLTQRKDDLFVAYDTAFPIPDEVARYVHNRNTYFQPTVTKYHNLMVSNNHRVAGIASASKKADLCVLLGTQEYVELILGQKYEGGEVQAIASFRGELHDN